MKTIAVSGSPTPQPRARISTRGKFARAYVPAHHAIHEWRRSVAEEAAKVVERPTESSLGMKIDIFIARPKSHYLASGKIKKGVPVRPRPDVDNYAKGILDALEGIIFENDSQIVSLVVRKQWANRDVGLAVISWRKLRDAELQEAAHGTASPAN